MCVIVLFVHMNICEGVRVCVCQIASKLFDVIIQKTDMFSIFYHDCRPLDSLFVGAIDGCADCWPHCGCNGCPGQIFSQFYAENMQTVQRYATILKTCTIQTHIAHSML